MANPTAVAAPDASARGLLAAAPDALRYGGVSNEMPPGERFEVSGVLRKWMPEGVRVLDVGCGAGATTMEVNKGKSNSVLCLEPDSDRAEAARARGLEVVCGVLDRKIVENRGPFDVIMFTDVLEHLASPADLLDLAASGLAPGGVIMASVPNVAHWTVRLKLLFGHFDYADYGIMDATHLRWFTRSTIRSLFETQGFEVESIGVSAGTWMGVYSKIPFKLLPYGARISVIAWLARTFPRLFGCQHVVRAKPR